jgi:methylmalonyl-CoA mutase
MNQTVAFPKADIQSWIEQLKKDLKGGSMDQLTVKDSIEELEIESYQNEETIADLIKESSFPYSSNSFQRDNSWTNGVLIEVSDERTANSKALKWLMSGVNYLVFRPGRSGINWNEVFEGIGFEHIRSHFEVSNVSEIKTIIGIIGKPVHTGRVSFAADIQSASEGLTDILKEGQFPVFNINAFELQAAGAATFQELGYALNEGHEHLLYLMQEGLTIDQAAACVHFHFGVGSQYLLESSKFSVFRQLWSKIVSAYKPEHACSHRAEISAWIGHMNKSLKDPYTNLLRQTTEALSAVNGGVSNLLVMPYDLYSKERKELAERMAVNISLILGSESHLDKVIDPLNGSYVMTAIHEQVLQKAWDFFLKLESKGGLRTDVCRSYLIAEVLEKRNERIQKVRSGEVLLIGINKYPNPEKTDNEWSSIPSGSYLELNPLLLEKEIEL